MGYSTDLVSNRQYDKESYIQNLLDNFDNSIPEFITAVDKFSQKNNFIDILSKCFLIKFQKIFLFYIDLKTSTFNLTFLL